MIEKLHLTHDSPIPRFLQLKSQFEYLIITGELAPGAKLPSIRSLSRHLGISGNTLVRAYRELEDAGLAVSNPGAGFFVRSSDLSANGHHREARREIRDLLHATVHQGLSLDQIVQIFTAEVAEMRERLARREIMALCKRDGRIEEFTARLQQGLAGCGVQVTGVPIEEIAEDSRRWLPRFLGAELVVSMLFDIRAARSLLEPHGIEIVPVLVVPSPEVRERIVHLPPGTKIGIVASAAEFIDGMITAITDFNPAVVIAGAADARRSLAPASLLASVDCVVYGTLTRTQVLELLPRSVEGIELLYVPDEMSLRRLHGLLQPEVVE